MNFDRKSTAGPRQFEQTAVEKLKALGVPKHVADAFVKIGLPKSGRVQAVKDHVCKMEYKPFFVETSVKDFENPLRVGAYIPHVFESKAAKFHCEFQMTDLEAAKFTKSFPEYDVTAKGKTTNQHAFYANKRYAEAELLVDYVFKDAKATGRDPRSLVDLGGNDSWHKKRGREYVHCDNPILSARDVMRYTVRQIFSGSNREKICDKKFEDCTHVAGYAISVHATYDMTPKKISNAMLKRGIHTFFGVINFIPGIENKQPGQYEADGVTMELVSDGRSAPYLSCGFKHDSSLRYEHKLSTMRRYMFNSQAYDFTSSSGSIETFVYRIESVRGNSVLFSIKRAQVGVCLNTSVWSPPAKRCYFISLHSMGVKQMEVDAEMFDRLVLQAASARNIKEYDILSLYRYAKSLRQRVSIAGVVLSSGYLHNPHELVYAVVAAYATAAAFRVESGEFFKRASSQIVNLRSQGFIKDVFTITSKLFLETLLLLPKTLAYVSGLQTLDQVIKRLIDTKKSVSVEVFKPHKGMGMKYNSSMLTKRVVVERVKKCISDDTVPTLRSMYYGMINLPQQVVIANQRVVLYSMGTVPYDEDELPGETLRLNVMQLTKYPHDNLADWSERARKFYYDQAINKARGGKLDSELVVAQNGDRIVRHGTFDTKNRREANDPLLSFVGNRQKFAVLRGVGDKVVKLTPPPVYDTLDCVGFYLFFEGKLPGARTVEEYFVHESQDLHIKHRPPSVHTIDDDPYVYNAGAIEIDSEPTGSWTDFVDDPHKVNVKYFSSSEEGSAFMSTEEAIDGAYMSGALPEAPLATPPAEDHDQFVRDYSGDLSVIPDVRLGEEGEILNSPAVMSSGLDSGRSFVAESVTTAQSERKEDGTVASDEVVHGKNAIEEIVYVSEQSEKIALASTKLVIDLAVAVARGQATESRFAAVAQGHPGKMQLVKVSDDGQVYSYATGNQVEHMAVSDGKFVYDRITNPPSPGVYVTSDVMKIYTGAAIKKSLQSVVDNPYVCPITCVDGVAGSGKSYHIMNNAKPGDVVLCETRESLVDLASDLMRIPGWTGSAFTVDSYLMNVPIKTADTLWVDEAFRLHAGKMYALMKLLSPKRVCCFGDSKQIPVLPFIPMYEFEHHQFPYSRVDVKRDTWRCPSDVCMALSTKDYYGFTMTTHNPIMRSLKGPVNYRSGMFQIKEDSVALLVFEKDFAHELRAQGLKKVFTIGESQGKTFDHVMLYRSSANGKQIYYDRFQALVGLTRHRKSFMYVTVCSPLTDDSAIAKLLRYVATEANQVVFSSHYCKGVKPAEDYIALENRLEPSSPGSDSSRGEALEVSSRSSDWADIMEEDDSFD